MAKHTISKDKGVKQKGKPMLQCWCGFIPYIFTPKIRKQKAKTKTMQKLYVMCLAFFNFMLI